MQVTYTEKAKQIGKDYTALQQATTQLEDVINPKLGPVEAVWDREEDDRGGIFYALRLSDATGRVSARFTPDELQTADRMRFRLLRLWGELLRARNELQLQQLKIAIEDWMGAGCKEE